jgi:hypothetical protein
MLELRTRLASIEAQVAQMPTQRQVSILLEKLSSTEASITGMNNQMSGMASRLETINNYLLNTK